MSWDVGDLDPRDQLRHTHCWPDTYTGHSLGPVLLQRGVGGQAFGTPPVNCLAQDIQIIPPHTTIPVPALRMIVQQQMQTASETETLHRDFAALSQIRNRWEHH